MAGTNVDLADISICHALEASTPLSFTELFEIAGVT